MLERFGARIWIARIMATWGVISMAMALVQGPWSFIGLRFLLGVAEAGFFPGVILYLTYWFPSAYRADRRHLHDLDPDLVVPGLADLRGAARPERPGARRLAMAVHPGGPARRPDGRGRAVVPARRPRHATWLPPAERDWLDARLREESARNAARTGGTGSPSLGTMLRDRRLILFAAIYFGSTASSYGLTFWTPQIVKSYGLTNFETGLLNSIPYGVASVAMILWGRHSDQVGERRWHLAIPFLVLARRARRRHHPDRHPAAGRRADRGGGGRLHAQGAVLGPGHRGASAGRGRRQHRGDQRRGQSRRLPRPLPDRRDQGRHRQLHPGPDAADPVRPDLGRAVARAGPGGARQRPRREPRRPAEAARYSMAFGDCRS